MALVSAGFCSPLSSLVSQLYFFGLKLHLTRAGETPPQEKMAKCSICGCEMKFDNIKGWVDMQGNMYKTINGKDDHCHRVLTNMEMLSRCP